MKFFISSGLRSHTTMRPLFFTMTTPSVKPANSRSSRAPPRVKSTPTSPPICDEHLFLCFNGSCIDGKLVCNGKEDCQAGEDEENCASKTLRALFPVAAHLTSCEMRSSLSVHGKPNCAPHAPLAPFATLRPCASPRLAPPPHTANGANW